MNRFSSGFSPMTLLSKCYCAQASWLAGLVFRVIESSGHTGVKCHGKGKGKVWRSAGNQGPGQGWNEWVSSKLTALVGRDWAVRFLQQHFQRLGRSQESVQVFLRKLCRLWPLLWKVKVGHTHVLSPAVPHDCGGGLLSSHSFHSKETLEPFAVSFSCRTACHLWVFMT